MTQGAGPISPIFAPRKQLTVRVMPAQRIDLHQTVKLQFIAGSNSKLFIAN